MDGLLIVDKPVGPTSHDVVARVRRVLGERRIGHTGTLDPAASGVLPLVIGRATRLARFLSASDKQYEAVIRLGWSTDTGDSQGMPTCDRYTPPWPDRVAVESALAEFRGTFLQQPPAYSAKKLAGRRGYDLARSNAAPSFQPVRVTTHALDLLSLDENLLTLRIDCSAGFYVRSLAADLGRRLGTGGHVAALRRTASGPYSATDAAPLERLEREPAAAREAVIALSELLPDLPSVVLTAQGATRAVHGGSLGPAHMAPDDAGRAHTGGSWIRLLDARRQLLAVARVSDDATLLHPSVVLK